jgi:prevent-host-death family protein
MTKKSEVSIMDLRRGGGDVIARVKIGGETIIVTDYGKPQAAIVSLEDLARIEEKKTQAPQIGKGSRSVTIKAVGTPLASPKGGAKACDTQLDAERKAKCPKCGHEFITAAKRPRCPLCKYSGSQSAFQIT